jgi:hypothetical protein
VPDEQPAITRGISAVMLRIMKFFVLMFNISGKCYHFVFPSSSTPCDF